MRGVYGNKRRALVVGAAAPDQGAAVPYLIVGGAAILLFAVLRDERRLNR